MPASLLSLTLAIALSTGILPAQEPPPGPVLTLSRAVERALAHEARYRAAEASFRAEREVLEQARSRLLPEVSANLGRTHNDLTAVVGDTAAQTSYISAGNSISLRQPLYRPERWASYQQAKAEVARLEAVLATARNRLHVSVASAYLELLRAAAEWQALQAQQAALAGQAAAAARGVPLGLASASEREERAAQAELAALRALQAEARLTERRRELENMVGEPVTRLLAAEEDGESLSRLAAGELRDWQDRAAEAAPEVRAARAAVEVAREGVRVASAGHKPTLDLVAARTKSRSETFTAIDQTFYNSSVGVQLNVPLYGGGRTESTVRQAVARQERSEAELQAALRDTAVLVEREHMTVRQAAQRLRAHAALVRSARQGVQAAQQGVARGTHAQLEVLEAQGRLQAAQQEHAATVAELLAARVRLQGLAGELSVQALPEVERVLVRPVQVPTLSTR